MNENTVQRAAHWQKVYQTKSDQETSWYPQEPTVSLELVQSCAQPGARIVDVGGGSSALCGRLVELGFDVTVIDIAEAAIARAKERIGDHAKRVRWIVGDVTAIDDLGQFDVWHDRAVFHFLIDEQDRRRYAALAARSVVPGGHLVIGEFALDGPEKCSGLPVERYDESKLAKAFSPAFKVARTSRHTHVTPWGKPQAFFFAVMQRD